MLKELTINEAMSIKNKLILDVRSPGEFIHSTVPGAVNIPLLDNVERAIIGKTYKNKGAKSARYRAMEIASPKLPDLVKAVQEAAGDKTIVLFCWRGGERSLFMSNILDFMGFDVCRIVGGFKAYRHYVRGYLEKGVLPLKAIVLYGLTGVGKTEVLYGLKQKDIPVLDLEGLSCHRGSVFGKIGMPPSPSQKMFEALIVEDLKKAEEYGVFVVECESKRLGNLFVPDSVINTMKYGYSIHLYCENIDRIKRIKNIYANNIKDDSVLMNSILRLKKYIGHNKVEQLCEAIREDKLEEVISYLLESYYDPLYGYAKYKSEDYDISINTRDMDMTVEKISKFIYNLPEFNQNFNRKISGEVH